MKILVPWVERSPKYWYVSLCNVEKLFIHQQSYQKIIYLLRNCQAHKGSYKLSNILTFEIWKPRMYYRHWILSVVLFYMTGSFCSFSRKYLPNAWVFITSALSGSHSFKGFPVAHQQRIHLPVQGTGVWSLGWEDPGEGNGNPLQCSCLRNPVDRGAWWATVLGAAEELDLT